ncbi:MAG TPA: hypothetical protein PKL77_02485 [Candidatus Omnitrophota bacterium]|nr:hypothetical protein [Candidatus Omnitrophota bacterium]
MRRVIAMMLAILVFGIGVVYADMVVLKSGKKVEGKITERKTDLIMVDVEGVGVPYFLDEISEINGEKVVPPAPVVVPPQSSPVAPNAASNPLVGSATTATHDSVAGSSLRQDDIERTNAQTKAIMLIGVIMIGIIVLIYIYISLCLFLIAKKLAKEPAWLAWIPIGNLFLVCNLAGIRYWWLLVLLSAILPYLAILAGMAFSAFVWWHISKTRGKPAWLGILTILPVVNFIIIGYLAFSE